MKPNKIEKYFKILVLLCLSLLSFFLLFLWQKTNKPLPTPLPPQILKEIEKIDVCGNDCKAQIAREVGKAIATISATPKKTVSVQAPAAVEAPIGAKEKTAYLPLVGPITTTSTAWVDAPGTDFYLDLVNDYTKNAYVTWEASLKVANANGQAFVRLFDVTHGIAVMGSELSTVNNASLQLTSSGKLNLWSGNNLYRVQIKSLNSFEVTFGNGRIKIVY